jgi:hypothetical protein
MASKSMDVRMAQLAEFEKKLEWRLKYLTQKGVGSEKIQNDSIVKSLKSKIRESKARMAAIEKLVKQTEKLAEVKKQKINIIVEPTEEMKVAAIKATGEEKLEEEKSKKKTVKAVKEIKKESPDKQEKKTKEPKKSESDSDEAAPKKPKKQTSEGDGKSPQKRTVKKKEEVQ